jgi:hypothetical protein
MDQEGAIVNSLMLEAYQAIIAGSQRLPSAGSLCDRMWLSRLQCPSAERPFRHQNEENRNQNQDVNR